MKPKGSGSKLSPIAIDDSEDEVFQELTFDRSPQLSCNDRDQIYPQQIRSPSVGKLHTSHGGLDDGYYPPEVKKRKRVNSKTHDVSFPGPSKLKNLPPPLETRFSTPMSKKARKRRRKLEAVEAEYRSRHQSWANGANHLMLDTMGMSSWTADGMYNPIGSLPASSFHGGNDITINPAHLMTSLYPQHYANLNPYDLSVDDQPMSMPSSSTWVSSMTIAAETQPTDASEGSDHKPSWAQLGGISTNFPSSATSSLPPINTPLRNPTRPIPLSEDPPPPKPPPQPIGMKPDQDPSSKHGLFQIPSASGSPYIPNPARTLVLEQLPKSHRTADFVNKWSKGACGAHPVYFSINAPMGKALVEFATAELARKAWGSPRLGVAFVGLKPHQLKGRPREDLIKAWWYRVDGVGAGAGVGEIEEGEIEGDAAEKEVDVPLKKETKKERKARLAQERAAKKLKQNERSNVNAVTEFDLHPPPASFVQQDSQSIQVMPLPYYSQLHPNAYQYSGYHHAGSPLAANSQSYFAQPQQLHTALPPQSHLATQWRRQDGSGREWDETFYGVSIEDQQQNTSNDHHSIASSGASIASTRSPSPIPEPHETNESGATDLNEPAGNATPAHEGYDDMDLDSPDSYRHSYFPHSPRNTSHIGGMMLPRHRYITTPPPQVLTPILKTSMPVGDQENLHPSKESTSNIIAPDTTHPFLSSSTTILSYQASPAVHPPSSARVGGRVSPPSITTPTPGTTSLAPSEPKAMKNPPTGPSYAKRSLLARQKELEEKIAKSKMELSLLQTGPPAPTSLPPTSTIIVTEAQIQGGVDKQAMEDRLRTLVLRSQRNKSKSNPFLTPSSPSIASNPSPLSSSEASSSSSSTAAISQVSTSSTVIQPPTTFSGSFSLDDLAVSFITETIQTVKAAPQPHPKPPSLAQAKLELAAKQKRLEQHIAESKVLMSKLTQARTKQEKDSILANMREKSRMMEEEQTPTSQASTQAHNDEVDVKLKGQASMKWPNSHQDTGVFIVSDDEDESDENSS